jgi:hypothetical protein
MRSNALAARAAAARSSILANRFARGLADGSDGAHRQTAPNPVGFTSRFVR